MLNDKHTVQHAQYKHANVATRYASEHALSITPVTCIPNINSSDTAVGKHRIFLIGKEL